MTSLNYTHMLYCNNFTFPPIKNFQYCGFFSFFLTVSEHRLGVQFEQVGQSEDLALLALDTRHALEISPLRVAVQSNVRELLFVDLTVVRHFFDRACGHQAEYLREFLLTNPVRSILCLQI